MSNVNGEDHAVRQRWFIAARSDVDLRALIAHLKQRGLDPFVLGDVAELGTSLLQSVSQAIARADLVLLVLAVDENSANVMFEAGMAVGMGKPVIVLADPALNLPHDLAGLLTIRAHPAELGAIGFALDQAQGRLSRPTPASTATGRPLGSRVDALLDRLAGTLPNTEESALAVLKEAIQASGAIATEGTTEGWRYDLGIWSDDLDAIAANPLLIEIKQTVQPDAVRKIMRWLASTPTARLGLLVSISPVTVESLKRLEPTTYPVLVIGLHDLLERMRSASFAEVVRELRNRSAHGRLQ